MMHLKRVNLNVCSQKTCCTSTPNFFPFLPYQMVAISICLKHAPSVSFIRPTELPPAFLMKVHLSEITEVNKASKIFPLPHGEFICRWIHPFSVMSGFRCWPPPHSYTPRHDGNLAFSPCTPGRWCCGLALMASTKQCSLLVVILEQEQPRPRSQAFTLCLEFLRYFSASHTSQL